MDPSPLTRGKLTLTHSLPLPHWLIPAHAGENVHDARLEGDGRGLSPLTRGKPGRTPVRSTPAGLIPAHAGENVHDARLEGDGRGLSPLTRGKPGRTPVRSTPAGLIPAHAGKTNSAGLYPISLPAHPSSRGENSYEASVTFPRPGSSQLTRGKRSVTVPVNITARLIPAHAGKTSSYACPHPTPRAHPRSRGENRAGRDLGADRRGSSPLTRGKLDRGCGDRDGFRLIPAHAGKTAPFGPVPSGTTAHPRSRGENRCRRSNGVDHAGSSPLTRGKQDGPNYIAGRLRLIPAHAGKTCRLARKRREDPAHPRSRGENDPGGRRQVGAGGSSPLTRGKPSQRFSLLRERRLIPAHAGKTFGCSCLNSSYAAHPRSRGENW